MALTQSEGLRNALAQALDQNAEIILLGQDISDPYGGAFKVTKGLSTDFPGRVLNTPISEAAVTGLAAGMALRGFHPILEIMFSDFLTLCADQIINHAGKFGAMFGNTAAPPMLIRVATGGYRAYGPTHSQSMEKLFFGVPDLKIVACSFFHDPGYLLRKAIKSREFTLFVEHKLLYPQELISTEPGNYYKGFRMLSMGAEGDDSVVLSPCEEGEAPMITVVTYGGISAKVFSAARSALLQEEIVCEVIVPAVIKPLQMTGIVNSVKRTGRVLIVEETQGPWGWGSEIATQIGQSCFSALKCPVARLASKDTLIPCAKELENAVLPQEEEIFRALLNLAET